MTVAILIARNQPTELKHNVEVALDNDVTAAEISEIITHLAFYSGWPNAMAAVAVTKDIFVARGIGREQLAAPPRSCSLLIRRWRTSVQQP